MTHEVKVFMEGGVIQGMEVPEGVRVVVYDYDTDCAKPEELSRDKNGDPCIVCVWESNRSFFIVEDVGRTPG